MWPYGNYPQPPSQPVVFIPSPGAPTGGFDIDGITRQIAGLEALKKLMKEEKKDDKNDKKKEPNVMSVMLLMLVVSPVTGFLMSKLYSGFLTQLSQTFPH